MEQMLHKELSDKVLGMAFSVHNILGPGLLESAYEGAFCVELERSGPPRRFLKTSMTSPASPLPFSTRSQAKKGTTDDTD
jgi:hypothetical protein